MGDVSPMRDSPHHLFMSSLRPTQHIERVPALRDMPTIPRPRLSFGTALVVAIFSTLLITLGVAHMATAAAPSIEVPALTR